MAWYCLKLVIWDRISTDCYVVQSMSGWVCPGQVCIFLFHKRNYAIHLLRHVLKIGTYMKLYEVKQPFIYEIGFLSLSWTIYLSSKWVKIKSSLQVYTSLYNFLEYYVFKIHVSHLYENRYYTFIIQYMEICIAVSQSYHIH